MCDRKSYLCQDTLSRLCFCHAAACPLKRGASWASVTWASCHSLPHTCPPISLKIYSTCLMARCPSPGGPESVQHPSHLLLLPQVHQLHLSRGQSWLSAYLMFLLRGPFRISRLQETWLCASVLPSVADFPSQILPRDLPGQIYIEIFTNYISLYLTQEHSQVCPSKITYLNVSPFNPFGEIRDPYCEMV